ERKRFFKRSRKFTPTSLSHQIPAGSYTRGVGWIRMSRIIDSLAIPILPAPMAGGPTTAAVVNEAARAGSSGTVAWGTISAQAAREQAEALKTACCGINLLAKQPGLDSNGVAVARELARVEGGELEA